MYAAGVSDSNRSQVGNYLVNNHWVHYNGLARYAQGLGGTYRHVRKTATLLEQETKKVRRRPVSNVDTDSGAATDPGVLLNPRGWERHQPLRQLHRSENQKVVVMGNRP